MKTPDEFTNGVMSAINYITGKYILLSNNVFETLRGNPNALVLLITYMYIAEKQKTNSIYATNDWVSTTFINKSDKTFRNASNILKQYKYINKIIRYSTGVNRPKTYTQINCLFNIKKEINNIIRSKKLLLKGDAEMVIDIEAISKEVKEKHKTKLQGKFNVRNCYLFFITIMKEYSFSPPASTFTTKEAGMLKKLNKSLIDRNLNIHKYLEFAVSEWNYLRRVIVWDGSNKSRLREIPSIEELCLSREFILQEMLRGDIKTTQSKKPVVIRDRAKVPVHLLHVFDTIGYVTVRTEE